MALGLQDAPGIGRLLNEHRFSVPNHQRDYSWTEDEVRELIDDILDAVSDPDSVYFVGLMVFMGDDPSNLTVLDGQQRLATAVIIFAAIRSWLMQYGEFQRDADDIQRDFIGKRALGKTEVEALLTLNSANDQTFNDYIVQTVSLTDLESKLKTLKKRDRNRRLVEAAIYVRKRIDELINGRDKNDAAAYLFQIVEYMRDRVGAVKLILPDEEMAYTVFETLNDRGLELSPLDLVKNHLFGRAASQSPARVQMMEDRWAQMMGTLSNVRSDNYLKAYWTSRHGRIRTRKLFDAFKKQYPKASQANTLSLEMLEAAEQYAALENADDPVWASHSEKTRSTVRALKLVGSQQAHPVMLSALKKMKPKEVERLLRLLEVCSVRYSLIGGGATGRFETRCAVLAGKIYSGEITSATEAISEMKEVYPADGQFRQQFAIKEEDNKTKAQYLLRNIEIELRRKAAGEMPGELQPGPLTVEHILPQNAGKEWEDVLNADPSIADDCTYRLGNLCLLTSVNKKLGRKAFADKKPTYEASELKVTNALASYSAWGRTEIETRQDQMAKLAAQIWRFQ